MDRLSHNSQYLDFKFGKQVDLNIFSKISLAQKIRRLHSAKNESSELLTPFYILLPQNGHFTAGRCVRRALKRFQNLHSEEIELVFNFIAVFKCRDSHMNHSCDICSLKCHKHQFPRCLPIYNLSKLARAGKTRHFRYVT